MKSTTITKLISFNFLAIEGQCQRFIDSTIKAAAEESRGTFERVCEATEMDFRSARFLGQDQNIPLLCGLGQGF